MNFEQRLRENGIKVTQHKLSILELLAEHKHLDATKIVELLHQKKTDVSLATVYRVLASFEMHQIITKHNFGSEHAIYELLNSEDEHHDHLICLKCGKVIEFINQQIEDLQLQIAKDNRFKLYNHTLNIYGCCEECLDNDL